MNINIVNKKSLQNAATARTPTKANMLTAKFTMALVVVVVLVVVLVVFAIQVGSWIDPSPV